MTAIQRSAARASAEPAIPDDLEGIDVALGLYHADGDRALYLELLHSFLTGQRGAPAQLSAALAAGDLATAERIAHATKGGAGTIGARLLHAQAAALELQIRNRGTGAALAAAAAALGAQLHAVLGTIEARLPAPAAASETGELDAAARVGILAELAGRLAGGDATAADLWRSHARQLAAALGEHHATIAAAIAGYEFDAALAAVRAAMQSLAPL